VAVLEDLPDRLKRQLSLRLGGFSAEHEDKPCLKADLFPTQGVDFTGSHAKTKHDAGNGSPRLQACRQVEFHLVVCHNPFSLDFTLGKHDFWSRPIDNLPLFREAKRAAQGSEVSIQGRDRVFVAAGECGDVCFINA